MRPRELGADDTALRRVLQAPCLGPRSQVDGRDLALVLLIASMATLATVPVTLFPSEEATSLSVSLTGAPGPPGFHVGTVTVVEAEILELEGVERVTTVVGTSTDNPFAALSGGGGGGANSASIVIDLGEDADIDALTTEIETLDPGFRFVGHRGRSRRHVRFWRVNLNINVTGSDFEDVEAGSAAVQEALPISTESDRVICSGRDPKSSSRSTTRPTSAGLNAATLAGAVRAYLTPIPATDIVIDDATVSVIVGTDPAAIASPEALAALPLGPGVALGDVAESHRAPARSQSPTSTATDRPRCRRHHRPELWCCEHRSPAMLDGLELPPGVEAGLGGAASGSRRASPAS